MARAALALVSALALALVVTAAAVAAELPLVVADITLEQYPRVGLELTLPAELTAGGSSPTFEVTENTRRVEVISAAKPKTEPVDVVLVIDTSGSMRGSSLDAAKEAARAFAAKLQPDSRLSVVTFADRPRLAMPLTDTRRGLDIVLRQLQAEGETALYDALGLAATEARRAEVKRPVIVLLSDGGDTVSRRDLDFALKEVKAARAPVLVVALPSAEADFGTLRSIARQTGGRFSTVAKAEDLATFYESLAQELQTTWHVTFVSRRPATKDLDIEIKATSSGPTAVAHSVVPNPRFVTDGRSGTTLQPVAPANVLTLAVAMVFIFISVAAATAAAALMLVRPRTTLDQMRYYDQTRQAIEDEDSGEYSNRVTSSILGAVDYVAGRRGMKRFVYESLERAGLPIRPTEYIAGHLLLVLFSGVLVQLATGRMVASILTVVVATLLPIVWVDSRIKSRQKAFEEMLPDILNLMAGALRAGWGLQQSIDLVVEQMRAPAREEFQRAQTEIRLGRSVEDALGAIADRIQSEDFRWAVTAIGIQREVGGNLAEVLDIVAKTIRDRGALMRQIAALTAEGRLSAWVLMLLPFVLVTLLSFLNPEYLSKLVTTGPGLFMVFTGVVLLVVGGLWLRKVVTIEV